MPTTPQRLCRAGLGVAALLLASGHALALDAGGAAGSDADNRRSATSEQITKPQAQALAPRRHTTAELRRLIDGTARRHGVEVALVHAVVATESAYNPRAVSSAGAVGLMQLMPATAADYGVQSRAALFDPSTNVDAGVRHLKRLLRKYRGDYGRVIMAYNAGEGVVDRTNSNVRFPETLDYTEAVVRRYRALGGARPTQHVLRKVSALRRPGGSGALSREPQPSRSERFGVLPAASTRLQAGLPKAPLDAVSPLRGRPDSERTAERIAEVQRVPTQGQAIRAGIDAARDPRPAPPTVAGSPRRH